MNNDGGPSIFAKHIAEPEKERPEPELVWMKKATVIATPAREITPVQQLLNWLQHDWPKPTICAREVYRYAPRPIRNRNRRAIDLVKILVERGWLAPIETHRRDRFAWQIMRGPSR